MKFLQLQIKESIVGSDPATLAFLKGIDELVEDDVCDLTTKMTRLTILLEGFYRSLSDTSDVKKKLLAIRLSRWQNHYGTPTITFLLTYNTEIAQTSSLFKEIIQSTKPNYKPWLISSKTTLETDELNHILVNKNAIEKVPIPSETETTGRFLKTHNPTGGFTTTPCDPISQKFIAYANSIAHDGKILEIGAAFGAATLQAIANGATIFCNDIDPFNLAVVKKRHEKFSDEKPSITGDNTKLILIPGAFPDELAHLPTAFFDAVLICRVMHFFTGELIEKSLEQLACHLKPGGKLFIVCETPFLKNWQRFIPEYEKRLLQDIKWPGEINNPADFESSGRASSLPKFVHWITKEVLEKVLNKKDYAVEYSTYINRFGQFPEDLLLDGRESVGAIAAKCKI